jgi:sporulation protein YlmC with PRC-barrel domain
MGVTVRCADGVCGHLTQVVVDPIKGLATDVIVEPPHREALGRLVPVGMVEESDREHILLSMTRAEFDRLPFAEETQFLPGFSDYAGYEPEDLLLQPYFGANSPLPVTVDTLPAGEVAVRRGESVRASDGHVGEVEGLVVSGPDHRVSHLVLKEGHFFGHKDVCVPLAAVQSVDDEGIILKISKDEVNDLPTVEFNRPR